MIWSQLLSASRAGKKPQVAEQYRSAFEQDFDRIIFSHPFRRLQDKTQVHPLPEHDFVHTRLTHSLEVSSVGRSLGKRVGQTVLERHIELKQEFSLFDFGAIVAAAALAHDLGNPPFGHAGEDAISDFFNFEPEGLAIKNRVNEKVWFDLIQFEGNAQGFRILNTNQYGLKLTNATLGAFTKYPHASVREDISGKLFPQRKYGFFQSEESIFTSLASDLGLATSDATGGWCRHPLAFLVEAADDICYSLIDLEDACVLNIIDFKQATELFEGVILKSKDKLSRLNRLSNNREKIGYMRALAIGDMIDSCTEIFLDHEKEILNGTFKNSLVSLAAASAGLKQIIDVSKEKIYRARHVVMIEASGHEVLPGLLKEFTAACLLRREGEIRRKHENLLHLLPTEIRTLALQPNHDPHDVLRLLIDFISGLTDRYALLLFRKIKGISH